MPHFSFKARKPTGEVYKSDRDAADRFEIYKIIRDAGEEIVFVEESAGSKGIHMEITLGGFLGKIKTIDKINFARNLGLMLEAGLALSRALNVIERQAKSKALKAVLKELSGSINKGNTFSDSLRKHPKIFPPIFIAMVHAGEQSGTLAESLKAVGAQMDSSYTLTRRIRGAMIYPAVIISVMVLIGILMMVFVVPTLMKTFLELNVELPMSTRAILLISRIFQDHGLLALSAILLASAGIWRWSKRDSGRKAIHMAILKAPVIGPLAQEVNAARTARTLSSLLSAGVEVVESVAITGEVVQNVYFRGVLKQAEEAIKKGDLMSKIFAEHPKLYPAFFAEMLSVGEETGKIGDMLLNVAHFYESDVEQKTKDMSTIIEPILLVVIGAGVAFFAVSMISPMYSLVNVI